MIHYRFTFLPFSLIIQFKNLVNVFIFVNGLLQFIPQVTTNSPFWSYFPLMCVLAIAMAKEGLIDYRRYQSDKEANNKKTLVLNRAIMDFEEVFWKDVKVGDIIKVGENKWVPADLIVLATSDKDGQGYVSTATLDGEQTLKPKQSIIDL